MTSDKNKNPEEGMEEDFADFEDDFAEEGLDEGLEESFHDEEGEEFVEEDWEAYDEEGDFPMAADEGKKSSKLLVIVGGLVLLGVGGYAAMQFMGGGAPQEQADTSMPEVAEALPVPDATMSGDEESGVDMAASRNEMPSPTGAQDFTPPPSDPELDFEMPMPFSNNNEPEEGMADSVSASDTVEAQPLTPMPQIDDGGAAAPGLMASGAPADNMQAEADDFDGRAEDSAENNIPAWAGQDMQRPADDTAARAISAKADAIDSNALATLESKLDMLFNRLDSIESELEQVKQNVGTDNNVSALEDKIRRLEREVDNMDTRPARGGASSKSSSTSPRREASVSQSDYSAGSARGTSAVTADNWILTSAQPGKATLRRSGGNDVISVEAGDSVSGLGRIISVGLENGKWVVQATSGSVSQ